MSQLELIEATAMDLFQRELTTEVREAAERLGWAPTVWDALVASGLDRIGDEASLEEAAAVVRVAARFGAPVPLAETVLAAWIVGVDSASPRSVVFRGRASYGRFAKALVIGDHLSNDVRVVPDTNIAGEPWDRCDPAGTDTPPLMGGLMRAIQLGGALEGVLDLTLAYATERRQFGRPIIEFQAIQSHIARLVGEVSLAKAAVDVATRQRTEIHIAAARSCCGRAATVAAAIAHQVHGAIGITREHQLHRLTRRLWAWRDEFGSQVYWTRMVGELILDRDGLLEALC